MKILGVTNEAMFKSDDETPIQTSLHRCCSHDQNCNNNEEQNSSSNLLFKLVPSNFSSSMNLYCYQHRLPPTALPEDEIKQNIDEVINSISVPSILPDIIKESSSVVAKKKRISFSSRRIPFSNKYYEKNFSNLKSFGSKLKIR